MSSPLTILKTLQAPNLKDFAKAVKVFEGNKSDEEIRTACTQYFTKHLLICYKNERVGMPTVSVYLATGEITVPRNYELALETIQDLGVDIVKALEETLQQTTISYDRASRARKSHAQAIIKELQRV